MTESIKINPISATGIKTPRPNPAQDEVVIDLHAVSSKLWSGRWKILICTLMCAIIGYLVGTQTDPVYRATAKLLIDPQERAIAAGGVDARQSQGNDLNTDMEILRSGVLVSRVIDQLSLMDNPSFNVALQPERPGLWTSLNERLPIRDSATDLARSIGLLQPTAPAEPTGSELSGAEAEAQAERQVADRVFDALSLRRVPETSVIEIGLTANSPRLAARMANAFAEQYIAEKLQTRIDATQSASDWLGTRVEELRLRVQDAESHVNSARNAHFADAGQSRDVTARRLDTLGSELVATQADLWAATSTHDRLRSAVEAGRDYGLVPEFRASAAIATLLSEEREQVFRRQELAGSLGEDHELVKRIDEVIARTREVLRDEALQIVEGARVALQTLVDQETAIEASILQLEALAREQSLEAIEIRQLEREAEASRRIYETFLGRMMTTAEEVTLDSAEGRILSAAVPPLAPIANAEKRAVTVSVIFGLFAGAALVLLLDRLSFTIRNGDELESISGQRHLGSIPKLPERLRSGDIVNYFWDSPESSIAEAIRGLRTSIFVSRVDDPPKVVAVTSSVSDEGKSTTSMLLAIASVQTGRSTLLIDGDLRKPSLSTLLNGSAQDGSLLSVFEGTPVEDAIYTEPETGLDILQTHPSDARATLNAADLLSSRLFSDMLQDVRGRYDLVIIDTPPTLSVADARIISQHVDAVLYVVKSDSTSSSAVRQGLKRLRQMGAPVIGVVLTMVKKSEVEAYGYGYGYGASPAPHHRPRATKPRSQAVSVTPARAG